MKLSLLTLAVTMLASFSAQARVQCEIVVPDPVGTKNYTRKIHAMDVVENPSQDPTDRSRSRYVVIRPDLSAVQSIDSTRIDRLGKVSDPAAQAGDTIVWVQAITSPGYYAIDMSTLTADLQIDPNWDGAATGAIPAGFSLDLTVPRKSLGRFLRTNLNRKARAAAAPGFSVFEVR